MLKASIQDIDLLAGYLHDAYFKPEEMAFDAEKRCFELALDRVCYERGERGKALLFFHVIRYPWIRSHLAISGVIAMDQKWKDRGVDGPGSTQQLLDIEARNETAIDLWSAHLRVCLTVCQPVVVTIQDKREVDTGRRVTDFSKGIFHGLDEIEKLRVKDLPNQVP